MYSIYFQEANEETNILKICNITNIFRLPSDELTADDLKSLRTVLQNQIRARKEDSRKFDSILAENREAYLAAVELIQKQN